MGNVERFVDASIYDLVAKCAVHKGANEVMHHFVFSLVCLIDNFSTSCPTNSHLLAKHLALYGIV